MRCGCRAPLDWPRTRGPAVRQAPPDWYGPPRVPSARLRWPARAPGRARSRWGWRNRRRRPPPARGAELRSVCAFGGLAQGNERMEGMTLLVFAGSTRNVAASACACAVHADPSRRNPWGTAFGDVLAGVGQDDNAPGAVGSPLKNSWKVARV